MNQKLSRMLEMSSAERPSILDDEMLDSISGGGCEASCQRTCGTTCDNTCSTSCASTAGNN